MFSFRRKNYKKQNDQKGPVRIRSSPSLPDLSTQGINWPESLVDVSELPAIKLQPVQSQPAVNLVSGKPSGPISALYMSHPPSAFQNRKSTHSSRRNPSQRKGRGPVTFNVMVAGAQGTGKTSLLRLLLETAEISPTASESQRAALHAFLQGPPKRTRDVQTVSVEICESKFDRLTLSAIDTAGLDFQPGHELTLERQISSIVKHIDTQFADTLSEESKVIRQSKGDQHVHLCIYTIDPSTIMTAAARRSLADYPSPSRPRAKAAGSRRRSEVSAASAESLSQGSGDDACEHSGDLTMSPADVAVMQRLAKKTNLLPVIARADTLTDDALATVKSVVRRDLAAAGLDFGVFGPPTTQSQPPTNGNDAHQTNGNGDGHHHDENADDSEHEERRSRPVIKLRPSRNPFKFRTGSRSRSRLDLTDASDEPATVDTMDNESVASVRFSAHTVSKTNLSDLLPFALIAPEYKAHRTVRHASQFSRSESDDRSVRGAPTDTPVQSPTTEGGYGPDPVLLSPTSPQSHAKQLPFLDGPPADLRGVFTRSYRWGTIDVLAPEHCDFAALRTAVLSTHMKMLKIRTREVLYERFRTEKLLARRATRNIGEDETRRMFEEVGL